MQSCERFKLSPHKEWKHFICNTFLNMFAWNCHQEEECGQLRYSKGKTLKRKGYCDVGVDSHDSIQNQFCFQLRERGALYFGSHSKPLSFSSCAANYIRQLNYCRWWRSLTNRKRKQRKVCERVRSLFIYINVTALTYYCLTGPFLLKIIKWKCHLLTNITGWMFYVETTR